MSELSHFDARKILAGNMRDCEVRAARTAKDLPRRMEASPTIIMISALPTSEN